MSKHDVDASALGVSAGKTCVVCGMVAPQADEMHTLISMKHGWRCTVATDATGRRTTVWRCPTCWARLRAQRIARS